MWKELRVDESGHLYKSEARMADKVERSLLSASSSAAWYSFHQNHLYHMQYLCPLDVSNSRRDNSS